MKFEIAGDGILEKFDRNTNFRYYLIFDVKPLARFIILSLIRQ